MKTITAASALCFLSSIFYAQRLAANSVRFKTESIIDNTLTITTGYDKEFDEAVKFACDTFWKVSPIKYIVKDK